MIYSNVEYTILLLLTLFAYLLARNSYKARFAILVTASLLFYSWLSVVECGVFLFVVIFSWLFLAMAHRDQKRKKLWLTAGIVVMTLHLFLWKYAPWLTGMAYTWFPQGMNGRVLIFPLPAGISFFTLQGIAYLVDYGRGEVGMMPFRKYLLFKSFFPQLVAGPIVRAETMLPQIDQLPPPEADDIWKGVILFVTGFAKKILIADRIAPLIQDIYAHPASYDRTSLVLGAVGFTIQLWADFSGYTDMGRGSARLLGIRLPENFLSPYFSRKPSEFWRRWHITLSTWIRDYIYIPMGGNRGTLAKAFLVSILTMLLSGLWHGAAVSYVLWGLFHGLCLVGERLGRGKWPKAPAPVQMLVTVSLWTFSMIIFRAESLQTLALYFKGLIKSPMGAGSAEIAVPILVAAFVTMLFQYVTYKPLNSKEDTIAERVEKGLNFNFMPVQLCGAVFLAIAFNVILYFRTSAEALSFIYFKF